MSDTALAVLLCAGLFIGLPVVILVLRDRAGVALWSLRNPPEKLAAERRAYEARLLDPDWEFYERHLLRPAPAALRELFADHRLIAAKAKSSVRSIPSTNWGSSILAHGLASTF